MVQVQVAWQNKKRKSEKTGTGTGWLAKFENRQISKSEFYGTG